MCRLPVGRWTSAGTVRSNDAGAIDIASQSDVTLESTSVVESHTGILSITGGETGIVAVSGTLDASGTGAGETGGSVHVLGEKVGLTDSAQIDVSGENGGGTVLVGGAYQGKDPDIRNATATFVSSDAVLEANAGEQGDGGTIIVWADEVTRFYGTVEAQGGSISGDGGFAEVSGKHYLDYWGTALLGAAAGRVERCYWIQTR